jgi:hypothetical protein
MASDIPRDSVGRYLLPSPTGDNRLHAYDRVTTFAHVLGDTADLHAWDTRQVLLGAAISPKLSKAAARTPTTDTERLAELAEQARRRAGARTAAERGTAVHYATEQRDKNLPHTPTEDNRPAAAAWRTTSAAAGIRYPRHLIERTVVVPRYDLAGTFDRIGVLTRPLHFPRFAIPAGAKLVVDLKTGRSLSYAWPDIAIQLAVYAMATEMYSYETEQYERLSNVDQRYGLVIHCPLATGLGTIYAVDLATGRAGAELTAQVLAWRDTPTGKLAIKMKEPDA